MSTDHNEAMRLSKPEAIAQFAQQAANEGPMVHTVPWQQLSGGLLMCSNAIRDLLAERDQLRAEVERLRAPLSEEQIWYLTNDGMRNAAGGIYESSVIAFARAVERAHVAAAEGAA